MPFASRLQAIKHILPYAKAMDCDPQAACSKATLVLSSKRMQVTLADGHLHKEN